MFCPMRDNFCQTLQRLSTNVWHDLQDAKFFGSPLHEESITQYNSLELTRRHPHQNDIKQCTKFEEKKNGADWLWLLYEPGSLRYVKIAVQAKRLYDNDKYDAVKLSQAHKLIRFSAQNSYVPIYVFYNHPGLSIFPAKFFRNLNSMGVFRYLDAPSDLGCTFVNAHAITVVGENKAREPKNLSSFMRPWWHIACKCRKPLFHDDKLLDLLQILQDNIAFRDIDAPFIEEPSNADGAIGAWLSGENIPEEKLFYELGLSDIDPDDPDAYNPIAVIKTEVRRDGF